MTDPRLIADTEADDGADTCGRLVAPDDVRVCIPLDVVQAMVRLLEEDHAAWPMDGQEYVLRALKAEVVAHSRDWDAEPTLYDPDTGVHEA